MIGGVGSATQSRTNKQQQAVLQSKIFDKEIHKKKNIPPSSISAKFLTIFRKNVLGKMGLLFKNKNIKS